MCVPALSAPLKNRKPVMTPSTSERNRTPSSMDPENESLGIAGRAVSSQMLHGQAAASLVLNDHVKSVTKGLPARSFAPDDPPATVAV